MVAAHDACERAVRSGRGSLRATATHHAAGNVAVRVAPALALGAFAGAYAGGRIGSDLPEDRLRWGFSFLMLLLGSRTLFK